jgi:hypothetical protein
MRYWFESGRVVISEFQEKIELESGVLVRPKRTYSRRRYTLGDEVFVSWISEQRYPKIIQGERFVDSDAIEKKGAWERQSSYIRKYERWPLKHGYTAELAVQEMFRFTGIRAEQASDFEDEMLGVDLWIFVKMDKKWTWVPLDITLREGDEKLEKAAHRGVILIQLAAVEVLEQKMLLSAVQGQIAASRLRALKDKGELLSRIKALKMELSEFPLGRFQTKRKSNFNPL